MKRDDKFYMLSINPSQDEAAHLIRKVTGKQVTEFEQLTVEEQEKVIHELKITPGTVWTCMRRIFAGRR